MTFPRKRFGFVHWTGQQTYDWYARLVPPSRSA
jgi:hypothetical protein